MAVSRVTTQMVTNRVLRDLRAQTGRLLDLQRQLATGYKVNRPSDNPLAARRAIAARAEIAANDQYVTNIGNAGPFLVDSETALSSGISMLQRANELTLQGINSTNAQVQRDEIALEVNQLIEGFLEQMNTTSGGRYTFAGTRTLAKPFQETRNAAGEVDGFAYVGDDNDIRIQTARNTTIPINITGQDAFLGNVDILQVLIDVRDNLRASDVPALEANLDDLQLGVEQLLIARSRIGAVENRLESTRGDYELINIQLEEVVSDNLDADFAEVIVSLNAQTNAYQAALNASGRVIQPSLLDFIR